MPYEHHFPVQGCPGLDAHRALPHHSQQARPVACARTARDRIRRPQQCWQVNGHQQARTAKAPGLCVEDAGPHAEHQPVCTRPERRARRLFRRPARLRLCGGRTRGQVALAASDGRLPGGAAQPVRRRVDGRSPHRPDRPRPPTAGLAGTARGHWRSSSARVADQGRQAVAQRG